MAKSLEQVRQEAEQAYADSVVIPRWKPPDGEGYTARLTDVHEWTGASQAGVEEAHVAIMGEIEGGDHNGRRVCLGQYNPRNMGMLKEVAELILGQSTSLSQDIEGLKARTGTVVQFNVSTRTTRQGRDFTGCQLTEVLDAVNTAPDAQGEGEAAPE